MARMLSYLGCLPHQIMTTVLEYLTIETLYVIEQTSKSLHAAVQFNSYLKYLTPDRERQINPLKFCGAYSVHHAWRYDFIFCVAPKAFEGPV